MKTKYHCIEKVLHTYRASIATSKGIKRDISIDSHQILLSSDSSAIADSMSDSETSDKEDVIYEIDHESFLKQHMMKHMSYGDVGRISIGNIGLVIVNICIAITQFGFCVAYFIFIGNTIYSLFPVMTCHNGMINASYSYNYTPCNPEIVPSSILDLEDVDSIFKRSVGNETVTDSFENTSFIVPPTEVYNSTKLQTLLNDSVSINSTRTGHWKDPTTYLTTVRPDQFIENATTLTDGTLDRTKTISEPSTTFVSGTTTLISENSDSPGFEEESTATASLTPPNLSYISSAPNLRLLVLTPVPLFLTFALIRNVRNLGGISVAANIAILIGCVSVMTFILIGELLM